MTVLLLLFKYGYHFISFSYLISVARSSNIMLNRNGKGGHPCLIPDFKGKAFSFSPQSMMWAVGLSEWPLLCWNMFPINQLWWIFIMNGCLNLSDAFFLHLFRWSYDFYPFINVVYHIYLQMIKHTCIPGINPIWSCYMIFIMYF